MRHIQELLGHGLVATTRIYTHVSIGYLKETLQRCHLRERDNLTAEDKDEGALRGTCRSDSGKGHDGAKDDPSHQVHAHVDDMDVELRVVSKSEVQLGDFMAEGGSWKGESAEEILRILCEARAAGTRREPPSTNAKLPILDGSP